VLVRYKLMDAFASGRVKISRDAVGAVRSRRAVSGLTLSRKSRLKDSSGLGGKTAKATPTAELIFTHPAAYMDVTGDEARHHKSNCLLRRHCRG